MSDAMFQEHEYLLVLFGFAALSALSFVPNQPGLGRSWGLCGKARGLQDRGLHSVPFQASAGDRGLPSRGEEPGLLSRFIPFAEDLISASTPLPPAVCSPAPLPAHFQPFFSPTFFAPYLCLSSHLSCSKTQFAERLDLQMSGRKTGNKGNEQKREQV